ncbi:hypothetical protein NDU88_011577 [Pleurodeles waltl]|uniref:Uncharacterized protein n=1 Tax=Pleurodeles waltl TaxID=8319 RepID=A0AAV7S5A0_PLEWA|nr:hypothetical protein NDU88_011577 [Pleurodeles waltl]
MSHCRRCYDDIGYHGCRTYDAPVSAKLGGISSWSDARPTVSSNIYEDKLVNNIYFTEVIKLRLVRDGAKYFTCALFKIKYMNTKRYKINPEESFVKFLDEAPYINSEGGSDNEVDPGEVQESSSGEESVDDENFSDEEEELS